MNRNMELKFQIECLQDVAVVNCSGRMVRGAALDQFRRRIEQLDRVRVLVLERHYAMGGFTHTFRRPDYEWDVGLHYIGQVQDPASSVRRAFSICGGLVASHLAPAAALVTMAPSG